MSQEKASQRINIYGDLEKAASPAPSASSNEPLYLQEYASVARKSVQGFLAQCREIRDRVDHIVETGKAHSSTSLVTLREEESFPAQCAALGVGSILGYLFGIRRGRFLKRTFYAGVGFAGSYYLCYPEATKEMANEYGNVAYHFVDGVVKEDLADVVAALKNTFTVPSSPSNSKDDSEGSKK